jgi:hypothetical protein
VTALKTVSTLDIRSVARELSERVGLKYLAAIGGVGATRVARRWLDETGPSPQKQDTLRAALQAIRAIATRYNDDGARAWLSSTNPNLSFRAPLVALRDASSLEELGHIVSVAVQDVE